MDWCGWRCLCELELLGIGVRSKKDMARRKTPDLAWLDDPHLRGSSFVLTDNLGRKFSESVFTGYDLGFLGYSDCRDFRDFTLYFRDFRQDFMTFCTPDFRGSWPLEQTYFLRDD